MGLRTQDSGRSARPLGCALPPHRARPPLPQVRKLNEAIAGLNRQIAGVSEELDRCLASQTPEVAALRGEVDRVEAQLRSSLNIESELEVGAPARSGVATASRMPAFSPDS